MGKIILIFAALAVLVGVPAGCNYLLDQVNTTTVTAEAPEVAGSLADNFGIRVPPGYKGGFAMDVGLLGIQGASIVTLIPDEADPAAIFEGGNSIRFNPGPHTIVIGIRTNSRESAAKTRRDLQRLIMGDGASGQPLPEVFIAAGDRRIAAYEHRDNRYGQDGLGYFVFLDGGGLLYLSGPENGFDHAVKESLARELASAYPVNELLFAHVEPPQRDPDHPCGFRELPDEFEIQAVGIPRGARDLEGVALDPEDDDAGAQAVAVGSTTKPVVLILMSGEPTVWKVMSTPAARIAGVIASGGGLQRVIGLADGVPRREIDPNDRNRCRPFTAYQTEGYEYERFADRVWEIFAQGVTRMHTRYGGEYFRIGELTADPELRGDLEVADVVLDPGEHLLPGTLGLGQLRERGVLRPARPGDLDSWLANFEPRGDFDRERYRSRLATDLRMNKAFVITGETDTPAGMYGANSALFVVAEGVPEPGGDPGHNTFLYADGRCVGPSCPR